MLYIQKDLNDPSKYKIETRSKPDVHTVCRAPENEDIAWLDIVDDIDDITGEVTGKKAVVNEVTKAQVLTDRASAKAAQESENALRAIVKGAIDFGSKLMEDLIMENVSMGITVDGMSETVLDAMSGVEAALRTGTLHVAIARLKAIPEGSKDAKYITDARLLSTVNKIEEYLGLPLSQDLL